MKPNLPDESVALSLRLVLTLLLAMLSATVLAGATPVWTQSYVSTMDTYPVSGFGSRNIGIRADGTAVFGNAQMVRLGAGSMRAALLGPGATDMIEVAELDQSSRVVDVVTIGDRVFASIRIEQNLCKIIELGAGGVLWQLSLTPAEGYCIRLHGNGNELLLLTSSRRLYRLGLDGAVLQSVPLGSGTAYDGMIRARVNGGLLVAGHVRTPEGTGSEVELVAVSAAGVIQWRRTAASPSTLLELYVHGDGRFLFAHSTYTGANRLAIWRGDAEIGVTSEAQYPWTHDNEDLTCMAGSDFRSVFIDLDTFKIAQVSLDGVTSLTSIPGILPDDGPKSLDCSGDRMYSAGSLYTGPAVIRAFDLQGVIWQTTFADYVDDRLAIRGAGDSVFLAVIESAQDPDTLLFKRYDAAGVEQSSRGFGPTTIEPRPFEVAGSISGKPVVIARHGEGYILQAVDRDSGLQWLRTLRGDNPFQDVDGTFYQVRRRPDGGVDALGGFDSSGWFKRWSDSGSLLINVPGYLDDNYPDLQYAGNGDVLAHGLGLDRLKRVNSLGVSATGNVSYGFTVADDGRIFAMNYVGGGQTQLSELNQSLQPLPGTQVNFSISHGHWLLHPEGTMDFVSGHEIRRYSRDGSLIFSNNYLPGSLEFALYKNLASHEHGVLSVWEDQGNPPSYVLVRVRADGVLAWSKALPFRPSSIALDRDGNAGVAGSVNGASFANIYALNGSSLFESSCADVRQCPESITAIGNSGGPWFVAGLQPQAVGQLSRNFVREIDIGLFASGFE